MHDIENEIQVCSPCVELSWWENGRNPQRRKQQIENIMKHQAWLLWAYSDPCSVAKSCLTLCNPMDCSTPGFSVLQCLSEFSQTHILWVSDAIQPSHPLSSLSPPAFSLSQHQGLFQWVSSLHQVAKVLEIQL